MPDLQLTPEQKRLLIDALEFAYSDFQKLRSMIFVELNDPLSDVAVGLTMHDGAIEIEKWAQSAGRIRELSEALFQNRPANDAVIAYRASLSPGDAANVAPLIKDIFSGRQAGLHVGCATALHADEETGITGSIDANIDVVPKDDDARQHREESGAKGRRWVQVLVALAVAAAVIVGLANSGLIRLPGTGKSQFKVQSEYVGSAPPHKKPLAVVFVHGVFGAREDTWLNRPGAPSFPQLLASDPEFQLDSFVFEFYSPKFGDAGSIVDLADQLRGALDDKRVFEDHAKVVFLSHSMGGLIVRQFLLTRRELLPKIPMLYFYASPTNGAEVAAMAKQLSSNPQLRGMLPLEGNDFLQSIQSNWLNWAEVKKTPSYCAFETLPTYTFLVVSRSSATALCNQPLDPMSANHLEIVKPQDREDSRYSRFANALRKETGTAPPSGSPR